MSGSRKSLFKIWIAKISRCQYMDVICDTSFLIVLVSAPIQRMDKVETELGKLNFLVPDIVIDELKHLERTSGPKKSMIAKTAMEISRSKVKIVGVAKLRHVDDAIVNYAINHKCAAATIDRNLKKRLLANNILVITLSNNILRVVGPVVQESI
jgi:rRNA-processing protein FCF1